VNPAQQEQLANIGAYLQGVRAEKGLAIDEVANQIFIRPALVKAIETGDWESLPEPVFVQGFIRRYAEYLGLDGREISSRFEPTPVSVLPDPELANKGAVEGVVNQHDKHGLKVLAKADPTQNGGPPAPGQSSRPGLWLVGLLALAAVIGLILWLTGQNRPQRATTPDTPSASAPTETPDTAAPSTNTVPEEEAVPSEVESADAATESATDAGEAAPITFEVSLEGDAWMRVIVDGEEVYEGILTAGTEESWTAENELRITSGNSGAVLYSFNGSDEARLGDPGAVSNLTLTPDTDPDSLAPQ
jgi:cytoskeletal protein RodZ